MPPIMPPIMPVEPRHLLHLFSTFAVGGPEVRFTTVANRLGRRYRHTVVALDGDITCAGRLDPSLDVELLPLAVARGPGVSPANLIRFRRLLAQTRPDLLATYNWGAVEGALANRWRPVCRHLHFEDGFGPEEAVGRQLRRRVWLRRVALSGATTVVVPSRVLERIAVQRWRLDPNRVRYVPNGVDTHRFATPPTRADRPLTVGWLGVMRPEKNLPRLLRALPREPDARLVLVGDGPQRPALEALARDLGIAGRTVFAGRVDHPERVLADLDIFALPSDTEQMPVSLLEAMAAGLPVVATDVGDVKAMVAGENLPFIVPWHDEAAFAGALRALLRDPASRTTLGAANRARARDDFSEQAMVERYDRLFR